MDALMDALIFVANGLFLASYAVRDMLHLRVLAALAAVCLVVYFGTRSEPLVEAMCWNGFFALLNIVLAVRMLMQRRRTTPAPPADEGSPGSRCEPTARPVMKTSAREIAGLPGTA